MVLACSQARLLTLTARKSDCEYGIAIDSAEKMALAREQTELSQEYSAKLRAKKVCYYSNGSYKPLTYQYLMGGGYKYNQILGTYGSPVDLKDNSSMILTDFNGRVVMDKNYADKLTSVLGAGVIDGYGRGGTFSTDKIPEILAALYSPFKADEFRAVINGDQTGEYSFNATYKSQLTGTPTGNGKVTYSRQEEIQAILDFAYPIFLAAATNGWTTEYNDAMNTNDDYINEAIQNGTFQLATVTDTGRYDLDTSLTYFITAGLIEERNDSSTREEITAWYEAEKNRIGEKEDYIDLDMQNLSTELEAINTEIQAVQTLIDDEMSVFEWGNG